VALRHVQAFQAGDPDEVATNLLGIQRARGKKRGLVLAAKTVEQMNASIADAVEHGLADVRVYQAAAVAQCPRDVRRAFSLRLLVEGVVFLHEVPVDLESQGDG